MASLHSLHILILLLSSLCISISGKHESESGKTQHLHTSSSTGKRKLQNHFVRKLDESTNPVTNPANFPPITPTPTIVTVPASNPTTPVDSFPTTPPTTTTVPASTTPTTPLTNPANPGNAPVMNPNPPPNQPTSGSVSSGQSWCIANSGASEAQLQSGLDYACGIGGADCSTIQQGGSCYDPNSLQNHASYAFNSYYQKNPSPQSCDFGGAAVLVTTNPSTGSCVYPSSASGGGTGTAMPASTTPPTTGTPSSTFPTPTTTSSPGTFGSASGGPASGTFDSPPSLTNPSSNPNSLFPASYGPDSPPTGSTYPSGSAALLPDISFVILAVFFFSGKLLPGI